MWNPKIRQVEYEVGALTSVDKSNIEAKETEEKSILDMYVSNYSDDYAHYQERDDLFDAEFFMLGEWLIDLDQMGWLDQSKKADNQNHSRTYHVTLYDDRPMCTGCSQLMHSFGHILDEKFGIKLEVTLVEGPERDTDTLEVSLQRLGFSNQDWQKIEKINNAADSISSQGKHVNLGEQILSKIAGLSNIRIDSELKDLIDSVDMAEWLLGDLAQMPDYWRKKSKTDKQNIDRSSTQAHWNTAKTKFIGFLTFWIKNEDVRKCLATNEEITRLLSNRQPDINRNFEFIERQKITPDIIERFFESWRLDEDPQSALKIMRVVVTETLSGPLNNWIQSQSDDAIDHAYKEFISEIIETLKQGLNSIGMIKNDDLDRVDVTGFLVNVLKALVPGRHYFPNLVNAVLSEDFSSAMATKEDQLQFMRQFHYFSIKQQFDEAQDNHTSSLKELVAGIGYRSILDATGGDAGALFVGEFYTDLLEASKGERSLESLLDDDRKVKYLSQPQRLDRNDLGIPAQNGGRHTSPSIIGRLSRVRVAGLESINKTEERIMDCFHRLIDEKLVDEQALNQLYEIPRKMDKEFIDPHFLPDKKNYEDERSLFQESQSALLIQGLSDEFSQQVQALTFNTKEFRKFRGLLKQADTKGKTQKLLKEYRKDKKFSDLMNGLSDEAFLNNIRCLYHNLKRIDSLKEIYNRIQNHRVALATKRTDLAATDAQLARKHSLLMPLNEKPVSNNYWSVLSDS